MRWIEAAIETAGRDADELCARLERLGVGGFVIEDEAEFKSFLENNKSCWDYVDEELEQRFAGVSRVKFYLADDADGRAVLARIRGELGESPSVSFIADEDWENNWREYYKPIPVGERLIVVPEWEDAGDTERVPLRLDPGLIFGTGSHATTRMCLCELEKLSRPGVRVLDLGCGSGILAIGALLLGCDSAVGCDIDPKAPEVAQKNAALNGLSGDVFKVYAGDVLSDAGMRRELGSGYELVLANIVADVIIPLAPLARGFAKAGGAFVCSGIIEGRQDEVRAALETAGLTVASHRCEEEWHCFTCEIRN